MTKSERNLGIYKAIITETTDALDPISKAMYEDAMIKHEEKKQRIIDDKNRMNAQNAAAMALHNFIHNAKLAESEIPVHSTRAPVSEYGRVLQF